MAPQEDPVETHRVTQPASRDSVADAVAAAVVGPVVVLVVVLVVELTKTALAEGAQLPPQVEAVMALGYAQLVASTRH